MARAPQSFGSGTAYVYSVYYKITSNKSLSLGFFKTELRLCLGTLGDRP